MAKIARARPLPTLPAPTCPAAMPIAGAMPAREGVLCRVIEQDRQREDGVGVNPQQLAISRDGKDGDTFLSIEKDPQSVERLCCGSALPVLGPSEVRGNRSSYTYCPVWQAEKDRIAEGREMLSRPEPPQPAVSHYDDGRGGVREAPAGSSYDAEDPWAQARADLDLLAPPAGS